VKELMAERGVRVDASCIWQWVQASAPEPNRRCVAHLKPVNKSYRIDETYIKVKGEDKYQSPLRPDMGQEIDCKIRYRQRTLAGKAHLESDHILFRGEQRLKILFKDLKRVQAEGGILRLEFTGGLTEFVLGSAAEKWAHKILSRPSRLQKLGVKAGMGVRLEGEFDHDFLIDLSACGVEEAADPADLIFLGAEGKSKLARIRKLAAVLKPDGALWVVYPKGNAAIREIDVISAGRAAKLKDSKVASFSLTHTGLKFVIPLALGKHRVGQSRTASLLTGLKCASY
jgi:hypothetical protein